MKSKQAKGILLLILVMILVLSCSSAEEGEVVAKDGDTVKVHYTGRLEDGTEFDSSSGRDPLEFTIGSGGVIAGFNQAVIGMKIGESKTVEIPMEEAYGPYREELVQEVSRDELPEDLEPEVGQQLYGQNQNGQVIIYTVKEVSDLTVTLDANHRLAGEDLTFDIELVEIL